nr:chemotaxis protein CheW [Roseomonas nepalensis]
MLRLGGCEVAVPADVLQEVVTRPASVIPQLQAPPYVPGTFNLRGAAIPIVDLCRLFDLEAEGNTLAVVQVGGGRLALAVGGILDVLRVAPDQVSPLRRGGGSKGAVISALITLAEGERVVQVLDLGALVATPGVMVLAGDAAEARARASRNSFVRQFLFFRCDDFRFCLETAVVREIIDRPQLEASPVRGDLHRGTLRLRGEVVPVLDLFAVLALEGTPSEKTKLLVLDVRGRTIALPVSDILAIENRAAARILDLPGYGLRRPGMFGGVVEGNESRGDALLLSEDAILLEHEAIMRDPEVAVLRRLHDGLQGEAEQRLRRKSGGKRVAFLRFTAGHSYSVPIGQIHEIIDMPREFLSIRSDDGVMLGVLKRRGSMVPLVHLARLGSAPCPEPCPSSRVLVVRGEGGSFGFVVDSTDSMQSALLRDDVQEAPSGGELGRTLLSAASRLLPIDTPDGAQLLPTLDLARLARELQQTKAAA